MSYLSREPVWTQDEFVGREADVQWLTDMLARPSPQNCNLIGEPRIGKTSLLYQVVARRLGLPEQGVGLHVWLRLAELPDYQPFSFWQLVATRLQRAWQKAGLELDADEELPADTRDLFDELDDRIDRLVREAACQRLLILIDDFDLLRHSLGSRDLDWLRSLATRYAHVLAFVISSSDSLVSLTEKLMRREGVETPVSPFANMFHNRTLGLLAAEEAKQLCRATAVAEEQPKLTGEEIAFLLQEAGRHPALLKIACGYLFEARRYESGPPLFQDVRGDVRLDEHVNWLCRQLWQRRSGDERGVLTAVLRGQIQELDPVLRNLLQKHLGLVELRQEKLALFADAFAYWIEREIDKEKGDEKGAAESKPPADELTYLPQQRLVYVDEREVRLTPLEGRLLAYFLGHKNEVCTIEELLANVWGPGKTRSVVEKAVNRLRAQIEHDPKRPRFILSARGEGYLLRLE